MPHDPQIGPRAIQVSSKRRKVVSDGYHQDRAESPCLIDWRADLFRRLCNYRWVTPAETNFR
jgi:hypothetical protein